MFSKDAPWCPKQPMAA